MAGKQIIYSEEARQKILTGINKLAEGVTTMEEVLRVTASD